MMANKGRCLAIKEKDASIFSSFLTFLWLHEARFQKLLFPRGETKEGLMQDFAADVFVISAQKKITR